MRLLIVLLVYLVCTSSYAKSSEIEDLRKLLQQPLTDSAQIMVKTTLARELVYLDNAEAYQLVHEAITLSKATGLELEGAYALRILSEIFRYYGFYLKGSEILLDAKTIFEKHGDELGAANCYLSLGNFYKNLSNYELALANERKALQIFERLNVNDRLGAIYNNIGRSFRFLGQYDSAFFYCHKAIEVNKRFSNFYRVQNNYKNLGLIYLDQGIVDSAAAAFQVSLAMHDSTGRDSNEWTIAEVNLELAKISMAEKDYAAARGYIEQSREICVQKGYLGSLKKVMHVASDYCKATGRYEEMSLLWSNYMNLTDSLLMAEKANKKYIVDLFDERMKRDQEIATFNDKLSKQKLQIIVLLIVVVFVVIILIMYMANMRKVRGINAKLVEQKQELETLNQTKNKLFSVVAHDFIGPLSNVYSFSRLLAENRIEDPEEQKEIFQELNRSVENTIGLTKNLLMWARSQMQGEVLNPSNVKVGQLMEYVIQSISSQARSKKIEVKLKITEEVELFADSAHLEVIFRNLLSNAIKFSHPSQSVDVSACKVGGYGEIKFVDHGVGMSEEMLNSLYVMSESHDNRGTSGEKGIGLGLIVCKEFVKKNSGTIEIESQVDVGTTLILTFPLA